MVSQIRFGITWHKPGIWLICQQVGLRSEIFHPGSLFWKAKLSSLCQVIHKLIWLIKRVVISERDTCSLSQLFSVIVVAALFLCTLFHPPSPQSYSKIWTYRCHRQFTGLVFIHLLTHFFCNVSLFLLLSAFLMFLYECFYVSSCCSCSFML